MNFVLVSIISSSLNRQTVANGGWTSALCLLMDGKCLPAKVWLRTGFWGRGVHKVIQMIIVNSLDNIKRRDKVPIRQICFETVFLWSVILKCNIASFYNSPVCRKKE